MRARVLHARRRVQHGPGRARSGIPSPVVCRSSAAPTLAATESVLPHMRQNSAYMSDSEGVMCPGVGRSCCAAMLYCALECIAPEITGEPYLWLPAMSLICPLRMCPNIPRRVAIQPLDRKP